MTKGTKHRSTKKVNPVQAIIRSSKSDKNTIVRRALSELSAQDVISNWRFILECGYFKGVLLIGGRDFNNYYSNGGFYNFDSTLAWSIIALKANQENLIKFRILERELESKLIKSQYEDAKDICLSIERMVGKSIWLSKINLYIEQKLGGDYKKINKLQISEHKNKVVKFILNCFVRQLDDESSYFVYNEEHAKKLDEIFPNDSAYLRYLKYTTLAPEYSFNKNGDDTSILSFVLGTSIVDLLKGFNFSFSNEYTSNLNISPTWLSAIKFLGKEFPSQSVKNYFSAIGEFSSNESDMQRIIDFFDSYTSGDYEGVISKYSDTNRDNCFHAFEMAFKASLHLNNSEGYLEYCHSKQMSRLLLGKEMPQSDFLDLLRESSLLSGLEWFYNEHLFILITCFNLPDDKVALAEKKYFLNSSIPSPNKEDYLPPDVAKKYRNNLVNLNINSSTVELYLLYSATAVDNTNGINSLTICEERKKKYLAIHYYKSGKYIESCALYRQLMENKNSLVKHDAAYGYIKSLVSSGNLNEAEREICSLFLDFGSDKRRLPLEDVCSARKKKIAKNCDIYSVVCFSLYKELFDDCYNTALKVSFENIMKKCKTTDIDDVMFYMEGISENIKSYFLESVFVPSIIQGPIFFKSENEVENARITVCQKLINEKRGNIESLQSELKTILKNRALKQAKLQVENTKIYVDIDYVKSKTESDCRVLLEKYLELSNKDVEFKAHFRLLIDKLSTGNIGVHPLLLCKTSYLLDIESSESHKVFERMVKFVRDEFTKGSKGLSGYLSTRIIHGTLENHLKRAFVNHDLGLNLLQKSASGRYEFELSNFIGNGSTELGSSVDSALANFLADFDAYLNKILYGWLQVTQIETDFVGLGYEVKDAIFDYSISNVLIEKMRDDLGEAFTYEDFWSYTVNWLWMLTDHNLENVRDRLEKLMVPELREIFDALECKLIEVMADFGYVSTDVNAMLDESKQKIIFNAQESIRWFRRANYDVQQEVELSIVVESVRLSFGLNFDIIIEEGVKISGKHLAYYFDIIHNIIQNAKKHCKVNDSDINLRITITRKESNICITAINNCRKISDLECENNRLKKYADIYNRNEQRDRINGVGDTGYYRIQKTIKEDIGEDFICEAKYVSECEFMTYLEIIK